MTIRSELHVAAVLVATALCSLAAARALAAPPTELPAEQKAIFHASAEDELPRKLHGITKKREGKHYLAGNEWNLHLLRPAVKDLGGGYLGVGSDQAYLFIGWARPVLAWLADYDELVVQLHGIYRALFLAAETPDEFLALWDGGRERAIEAIERAKPDQEGRALKRLFLQYRASIRSRLARVRKILQRHAIPSFLTDSADYSYVRDLIKADRVRALRVNLLDKTGVKAIGAAAQKLGVPIRLLYLSNAEDYWRYSKQYRANVAALHFDEKSQVARTVLTWELNRDYHYNVQPALRYVEILGDERVKSSKSFLPPRRKDVLFSRFDDDLAKVIARLCRRTPCGTVNSR